eukprot:GHVL01009795.1.p1 GENE.GHVL01009795.1~~GHVL01009795.1.p1  ORF type:complete len:336 (-),score=57.41 GHVL01009795.1:59-1066(-)
MIVPAKECKGEACQLHTQFDHTLSASAVEVPFASTSPSSMLKSGSTALQHMMGSRDVVTVVFGTGQMSGVFVKDKVCVGVVCAVVDFITSIDESDEPFSLVPFDGILGLSLSQMSEGPEFNFLDALVREKSLKRNMFSVFLGADDAESSEITFGEFKKERMASDLVWVPVSHPGYWQVEMNDITIDNKIQSLCGGKCQVAVDTGTSLMAGPTKIIDELVKRLNVTSDCSNYESLPDLGFQLGEHILNIRPEHYVEKVDSTCSLALMPLDLPPPKGPIFVFGDPFLRQFYTVYDRDALKIGFALAAHPKTNNKKPASLLALSSTRKSALRQTALVA